MRAIAFQNVGVQRIEGLERLIVGAHPRDRRKQPTLGRVDIDVIEVMKVARIFQIAKSRHPMRFGGALGCSHTPETRCAQRPDAEAEYVPAGEPCHA